MSVRISFIQPFCALPSFLSMSVFVWWDLETPLALGLTLSSLSPKLLEAQTPYCPQHCRITGPREECADRPPIMVSLGGY